jgi:hypothetical protein
LLCTLAFNVQFLVIRITQRSCVIIPQTLPIDPAQNLLG